MEKIPLLLMFLGHVWVDASQGILPVVLAKLKDVFSLNYFQVGVIMTVLNLSASVIQPLFGHISDRLRTGWFVPAGILWTALTMGLLGWAPSYVVAVLLVGFGGLGLAAFHPRAMMAVYLVSGSRRGLGAAIFTTGGNVGFALGPVVPGVLLFLAIYFYPGDFLRREAVDQDKTQKTSQQALEPIPWVSLTAVCLIVVLRSWVYMSFITYLPMFLLTQGIHLKSGSLMLALFLASGAAAGLYGGHLSDRIGRRGVVAVSLLMYPLLTALFIWSEGPLQWLLAGASGAALLASFSVTVVMAQELLPRHLGLASGLILGLGFGAGGMGTAVSGYLADRLGLYHAVWILAFIPLLGAILTAFTRPMRMVNALWHQAGKGPHDCP
jgi:FSR family fosmidomycin resistance protein-like MFS transporter